MSSVLERIPSGARAAIIRLRSLGDCVLTTPALELLHEARPDLRVAIVVQPEFREVFAGNPAVSALLPPSASSLRAWRPELCLNLHGGTRSAWLTALSGARWRAGFEHFRFPAVYNVRIPKAQAILGVERTVHTAEHIASAMFFLGAPQAEIPRARLYASGSPPTADYAVIHPFASSADKTWPAEKFVALARALRAHEDVLFVGGAADDMSPFREFRMLQGADLEDVKLALAGASLFIGNDSGPAHMAAAFGVPLLMLWGNSDRAIWAPWKTECVVLQDARGIGHIALESALNAVETLRVKA